MIGKLLDLFWPRSCAVCERPVDRPGRYLCSDCLNRLPLVPTDGLCRICGRDAPGLDGEYLCDDCRSRATRPYFDRAVSAMRFEGDGRELVNAFKFREALYLRDDLVDLLEAAVRARFRLEEVDLVISMPSTLPHRFWRGYNQCHYLAKTLAERLRLGFEGHYLKRIGSPKRQGSLSEEERRRNVIGTFAVARKARRVGTVLVVDDIMTTGSTLSESAKTLKEFGVERVFCATVTRSVRA